MRVVIGKVFKLNQRGWTPPRLDGVDEFIQKIIVFFTLDTIRPNSGIQGIFEQTFSIGSHVNGYGQEKVRMDSSAGGVELKFTNRNAHTKGSEIAQTKDAFTVSYDNGPDLVTGPILEDM